MILHHRDERAETTYAVIMLLMLERERERIMTAQGKVTSVMLVWKAKIGST